MTLYILDLDNCLIYTSYSKISELDSIAQRKWYYLYHRPGLFNFLNYIQKTGEIVFYTSSKKEYAKWVVNTFNLEKDYLIFSRKFCRKKLTNYGEIYYKSIFQIPISREYEKIIVLDDRTDLWDEKGVELHEIKPYMGEIIDDELHSWQLRKLKSQPRIC
ncbi:MAG: HAD family hydrolase [Flavobacteriales bacterium]|nr:HAD family hydrolase [Flavobacteriales bacterium]